MLSWTKIKNSGHNEYVSGGYKIEPITGYYRWYLFGARYQDEGFKRGQREFATLKDAKDYAQKHADAQEAR